MAVISLHAMSQGQSSEDGIGPCVEGDPRAWEELYSRHSRLARVFLFRLGVDAELLDDAVQEVFVEVFRYLPRFRGECTFKTWLYRLCATQARQVRQKRKVSRLLHWAIEELQPAQITAGEIHSEMAGRLVQEGLSLLSEKERLVFVLYEFEGLGGKEVAEVVGCPEATVWRRLHYARKTFVSHIEDHGVTS